MKNYPKGVSVIICCYNSTPRLTKTLQTLSKQQCTISWEVVIVDNASTDNSGVRAMEIWKSFKTSVPIYTVYEATPGLSQARKTGISRSIYSTIIFCDDDNWLNENYIQGMFDILEKDSTVAACGGMGIPIFETKEPYWFYEYAEAFALGSQRINMENENILNLYGAGLAVRRTALDDLYKSQFDSVLEDRLGKNLSSAGDTELTYALVLLGYKLQCSDDLRFFHFLSKERLQFSYLQKLFTSFGNDGPVRNLYYSYISHRFFHRLIKFWIFHLMLSLFRLVKYFIMPPKKYGRRIYLSWNKAYIKSLWSLRTTYSSMKLNIKKAVNFPKTNLFETPSNYANTSVTILKQPDVYEKILHQ